MGKESKHAQRTKQSSSSAKENTPSGGLPIAVQQNCLDIFRNALWLSQDDLNAVQEVKGHLYNRDFLKAFSRPEYLRAYALRWSASRSLCYGMIFSNLRPHISHLFDDRTQDAKPSALNVVCIGGGAGAELVGLAAWLTTTGAVDSSRSLAVNAQLVDIADWSQVTSSLLEGVVSPPKLSKFASATAHERNVAFLASDQLSAQFIHADVLDDHPETLRDAFTGSGLVTIMFTLNELYTSSLARTRNLLVDLTARARSNTLLLIVDSPGSYSTVTLNGNEKRYPMSWLLNHTLLGPQGATNAEAQWTLLWSEESTWYRLPEGLQYPVDLENMRYQTYLYRRLPG